MRRIESALADRPELVQLLLPAAEIDLAMKEGVGGLIRQVANLSTASALLVATSAAHMNYLRTNYERQVALGLKGWRC